MLSKRNIVIGLVTLFGLLLPSCGPSTEKQADNSAALTPVEDNEEPTPTFTQSETTPTPTKEVENPADVIFHNGVILTIDAEFTIAEAIAIQGENILAVGSSEDILRLVGPETEVIDLEGQTMLPGFIDGHTHILAFSDRMGRSLDEAQETAIRYGFTTVNEMWADQDHLNRLAQAEQEGNLRLRVNVFVSYNAGVLDENRQKVLLKTWFPENGPILDPEKHLRVPGIKIFVDGAFTPGRGCWALSSPIMPDAPILETDICDSNRGDLYWSQDELNQVVSEAQNAGYRVAFHAMGDQAIETALNAIEFALNGQPNELHRHQIQHNSLTRPDQFPRYENLDVLVSVRGFVDLCDPQLGMATFGPDRNTWYANRYALPNLDIHAYIETDFGWTVDPDNRFDQRSLDPIVHLFGYVTHQFVTEDGTTCDPVPWAAVHVISVERALQMLSIEPAYAVSMEDYIGTLEPGKFADMIILSDNPMTVNPNDLKDLEVWMTMVGGKVEYCAPGHEEFCPLSQPSAISPVEPIATTAPEPTESPVEPVTVKISLEEAQVPANTPVVLTFGWVCDTPEQVTDFIAATTFDITLDEQPLLDVPDYWLEIEEAGDIDGDGDVDYKSMWSYPVGVLTSGTHVVDTLLSLQWAVTDGFDFDGDGLPDEYSGMLNEFSLQIVVEE